MASNILRNALAYKDSHRQDALLRNRLAAMKAEQAEAERLNALNMGVGNALAGGDLAGARDTAYRGGALDVGVKLDQHMRNLSAEDQKQFRDGIGIAATLVEKGLTGDSLAGAMRQFNFDDEDIAGIASLPQGALVAMRDHLAGGKGTRASLNPIFGTDERGNTVLLQPTESGAAIRTQIPEGVTISEPLNFQDLGTRKVGFGSRTGRPRAELEVDVAGEAEQRAAGTREGKGEISPREEKKAGQTRLSTALQSLTQSYLRLNELGAVVNPDRGSIENMSARFAASQVGQFLGGAVGDEAQSIRNRVNTIRPLIVQHIRAASGMSARGMDSNRELQFYLQAATDPTNDIFSNLVAIQVLDETFGLGNVLENTVPKDILDRVKSQAQLERKERPIDVRSSEMESGAQDNGGAGQFVQTEDGVFVEQ